MLCIDKQGKIRRKVWQIWKVGKVINEPNRRVFLKHEVAGPEYYSSRSQRNSQLPWHWDNKLLLRTVGFYRASVL